MFSRQSLEDFSLRDGHVRILILTFEPVLSEEVSHPASDGRYDMSLSTNDGDIRGTCPGRIGQTAVHNLPKFTRSRRVL
jgi:hypothetical protein